MSSTEESSSRGAVLHAIESKGKIGSINSQSAADVKVTAANRNRFNAFSEARRAHAALYKLLINRED